MDAQDGTMDYDTEPVPHNMGELLARVFLVPMPDSMDAVDQAVADELAARRQAVEAELFEAEKARKLGQIEKLGTDDMEDGTVVKFSKRLKPGGHAYTYAAVRINGQWYITGRKQGPLTNDEFCAWLVSGEPDSFVDFTVMVEAPAP